MEVPSESEWGEWKADVDTLAAHARFAGVDRAEAARRLGQGSIIERIDELRFMPEGPFRYYVLALCDFLSSDEAPTNDDPASAAHGFLTLVLEKLESARDQLAPVLPEVLRTVEYVASHQARFRARSEVYGSFGALLKKIRRLAAAPAR